MLLKITEKIFLLMFVLLCLWGFAFASFLNEIKTVRVTKTRADGIVVLTGGLGRVDAGIDALAEGRGQRLLISGANADLQPQTILAATRLSLELQHCCVDLDQHAGDTVGNVRESVLWAEQHGFRSLLVITSDYHLPRTLALFAAANKNLRIHPWPVPSGLSPLALAHEFNKYMWTRILPNAGMTQ